SGGGSSSSRSSGRSYSSGGFWGHKNSPTPSFSKPSAVPRPSAPSFYRAAAAAQRKQASKKSFEVRRTPPSGGSSPEGRSYSAGPPASSSMPTGRSYSVGRPRQPSSVKRPAGGSFDTEAAAAQRRAESKAIFTKGTKPRPTYTTPGGKTR